MVLRRISTVIFAMGLLFFVTPDAEAQLFKRVSVKKTEKQISGANRRVKKDQKEPREVRGAVRAQEKKEALQKKQYRRAVRESRERHVSIQSMEVRERMKQDEKERKIREREKRKIEAKRARKSGSSKKYKKR
ncbi:MAG: hypothetical protein LC649_06515 [Bacteroidales bacterium]|nr:hypothetical protein [Bacteroidales bacterium]